MRRYRSTRRQQQADSTRRDIVQAARRLFAQRGYAATSMTDIAAEADVAVQTIYASCGSKRDLVFALVDAVDEEAGVGELGQAVETTEDPRARLAAGIHLTRRLNERCGDIIGALLSAAAVEPDAAAAADEGRRRHREGSARLAELLARDGALRDGMTAEAAGALITVLTWQPAYAQLVADHGWSFDECERRIAETLSAALLRE